jgi:hypothetical protein
MSPPPPPPTYIRTGHSYERACIAKWLKDNNTSPKTGLKLPNKDLTPAHALRGAIDEWRATLVIPNTQGKGNRAGAHGSSGSGGGGSGPPDGPAGAAAAPGRVADDGKQRAGGASAQSKSDGPVSALTLNERDSRKGGDSAALGSVDSTWSEGSGGGPGLLDDEGATLGEVLAGAADDVAAIAADEAKYLASQDFIGEHTRDAYLGLLGSSTIGSE